MAEDGGAPSGAGTGGGQRPRRRRNTSGHAVSADLQRLLAERGYELLWREEAWHECLLVRGAERWAGAGRSRAEALDDALGKALPSHLGQSLLAAELRAATAPTPAPARSEGRAAGGGAGSGPAPGPEGGERADEADASAPAPRPRPEPPRQSAPPRPEPEVEIRPAPAPRLTREEAAEELSDLEARIAADLGDVATWSAPRQRLQLLGWMAWARAVQAGAGDLGSDESRVERIATRLGRHATLWWSGLIPALRLGASPSEAAELLAVPTASLESWEQVATLAGERLEEAMSSEEAEGADEQGWWDAGALEPGHSNPKSLLGDQRAILEEHVGLSPGRPELPAEGWLKKQHELVRVAKRLRWIRTEDVDGEAWAALVGRLRFLADRGGAQGLAEWLDPCKRPRGSWATELGWDPERKERSRERKRILTSSPGPTATDEELGAWLAEALASDLKLDVLAAVVQELAPRIAAIEEGAFSDARALRRRLAKLKTRFEEDLPDRARVLEAELASRAAPDVDAPGVPRVDPMERLLSELLPRTRGLRVLLVTNRADPAQDEVLLETFGFAALDHEVAAPRKTAALAERITAGRYDLVLSATGFQSHSTTGKLREAARKADVPYVQANRARRGGCIRALHRDLGVQAAK